MENKMNPVVHFEMPYDDKDRVADFYARAFGWEARKMGPDMGEYIVVATSEHGKDNMPKKPGMINGGFFKRTKEGQYPSVVIAVGDINEAMGRVTDAGGEVLGGQMSAGEPDDIPGVGLYVSCLDTEGNRIGVLQPSRMMSPSANKDKGKGKKK